MLFRPTVLRLFQIGFILSCRFSPSKYLRRSSLRSRGAHVLPGVSSLFAALPKVSTRCARSQPHAKCRPQVFSTSRRFAPPTGVMGLFHPTATSRVLAVQGFLPNRSRPDSSSGAAPMPFPEILSPANRLPRMTESTSRRFSAIRCVPQGRGLAFPSVAPLVGFSSSFRSSISP